MVRKIGREPEKAHSPQFIAIGGVLAAVGVTSTAAITAVSFAISAAISTAVSFAFSALLSLFAGRPTQEEIRRELSRERSTPLKRFVYGETIATGSPVPWKVRGSILYGCLILNSRPSDGSNIRIFLDRREVELDSQTELFDFSGPGSRGVNAPFVGLTQFWVGLGDQTTPPQQILDEVPEFFIDTDAWQGLTVIWCRFSVGPNSSRPQTWPRTPPLVEVVMRWSKVWDPRNRGQSLLDPSSWRWQSNQAMIALDMHTQNPIQPYRERDLELPMWRAAVNEANEQIPIAGGGTETRYEAHGAVIFNEGSELGDLLEPIITAGASTVVTVGGRVGLISGTFETPVLEITDLIGEEFSFSTLRPVRDLANQIHTSYVSEERLFETAELPPYSVPGAVAEDGGAPIVARAELQMVKSPRQAARIQKIVAYNLRSQKTLTCLAPPEALNIIAGASVRVNLPAPYEGMNGVYLATDVRPRAIEDEGVAFGVELTLKELFSEGFIWGEDEEPEIPPFTPVDATISGIAPPRNLVVTSEAVSTGSSATLAQAKLVWDSSTSASAAFYEVQFREVGDEYQDLTVVSSETLNAQGQHQAVSGTLEIGQSYDFRVRASGNAGASDYIEVQNVEILSPNSEVAAPVNPSATAGAGEVTLRFTLPNDPLAAGLVIFSGSSSNINAMTQKIGPIYQGPNQTVITVDSGLTPGVEVFYAARTIDNGNAPGAFSAVVSATPT